MAHTSYESEKAGFASFLVKFLLTKVYQSTIIIFFLTQAGICGIILVVNAYVIDKRSVMPR